jgi:lipopolysaccharide export system permease protein
MRILRRHYVLEFMKVLAVLALGLSLLFSLLGLIDRLDNFKPERTTLVKLALFTALNIPKYLYYLLPMTSLICCLFVLSQASRNGELVAVKATGGRLKLLFAPLLITGFALSVVGFALGEFVIPESSAISNRLSDEMRHREGRVAFRQGTLWTRAEDGALVRMELYVPGSGSVKGMSIFYAGEDRMRQRIEAAGAEWSDEHRKGRWILTDVTVYDFEKGEVRQVPRMEYDHLDAPGVFASDSPDSEEMDFTGLYLYARKLEKAGFVNAKVMVDLHSRVAYPIVNFFIVVLAASLSVAGRWGSGLVAAGLGLTISFAYWLLYTFMLSMGYARVIPPAIATWAIPSLFAVFSMVMFKKIQE